jgi:hypothetical protein
MHYAEVAEITTTPVANGRLIARFLTLFLPWEIFYYFFFPRFHQHPPRFMTMKRRPFI